MIPSTISPVIRSNWAVAGGKLYAEGTTLGGDDGIAVAVMLTILDGELTSNPPIECLFTSQEEIGLHGAGAFDCSRITARRMNKPGQRIGQ